MFRHFGRLASRARYLEMATHRRFEGFEPKKKAEVRAILLHRSNKGAEGNWLAAEDILGLV